MQVVLVMFRNDGERRSFSVVRNMTVIGRREDCDLRIPVGDVSRKHCRLVRTDDGIRIEDLGSSNGTYVNGERIQESELNAGDTVGVGPVQFIIQIDGNPDEEDMTPPAPTLPDLAAEPEPQEEMLTEEHTLEEIPAENEFQIEEEPFAAEDSAAMESPLEADDPAAELTNEGNPAESPLEELDEFEMDDSPAEAALPAAHAEHEDELKLDESDLDEEPTHAALAESHAPTKPADSLPADSLDELEFDEFDLEPEETAPAAVESPEASKEETLELAPAPPAYAEVDIDSTEDAADELEETHPANGQPADSASESSWDFVIEEADPARSHQDFKLDLDSPHEQPHGQA